MKSDRHVFLFPSLAIPGDEGWQIEVHAWCCRLRSHRVVIPLVRKALGFERARLSAMEKQTFAERARWMFADNTTRPRRYGYRRRRDLHVAKKPVNWELQFYRSSQGSSALSKKSSRSSSLS